MNQQKLSGKVTLVRALAGHDLWHAEKFCRQAALVDLLLLANTEAATAPARGGSKVDVHRGCVAYSIQSLARRWQWSDVKVTGYLRELAQQGVIKDPRPVKRPPAGGPPARRSVPLPRVCEAGGPKAGRGFKHGRFNIGVHQHISCAAWPAAIAAIDLLAINVYPVGIGHADF